MRTFAELCHEYGVDPLQFSDVDFNSADMTPEQADRIAESQVTGQHPDPTYHPVDNATNAYTPLDFNDNSISERDAKRIAEAQLRGIVGGGYTEGNR